MKRWQVAAACAALMIMGCSSNSMEGEATGGGAGADTSRDGDAGIAGDAGSTEKDDVADGTQEAVQTDAGADTATAAPPTCTGYCATVTAACTDDNAQYASEGDCMAYCEGWAKPPVGTADDTASNTIGCRIYHAEIAAQPKNAATHCPHAGPSGGGACGSWCDNYCQLATEDCDGEAALYSSDADCQTACAELSDAGVAGDSSGDTVQCRIYHLGVAGSDPAGGSDTTHCPHGGLDSGGVCVDPAPTCKAWCAALTAACTGDNAQFVDDKACLAYCDTSAQLQPGQIGDTSGDTIGCRTYHAGVAAGSGDDAIIHCPHAGPSGGGVCGSWCDTYCNLAMLNCTDDNALFASAADCQAACAAFPADGAGGDTSGDSVQCRIYHLGVAGSDMAGGSAAAHCPHGGIDGGGVCEDTLSEPTYSGQVQAILQVRCAGCHTGGGSGGHNIASSYAEVTKTNSGGGACVGTSTVGECAIKRIMDGSMPLGGAVPAGEKAIIQSWADAGFPQ